jgi:hypothetical protein
VTTDDANRLQTTTFPGRSGEPPDDPVRAGRGDVWPAIGPRTRRRRCDDRLMENVTLAWVIEGAAEEVGDGSPLLFRA